MKINIPSKYVLLLIIPILIGIVFYINSKSTSQNNPLPQLTSNEDLTTREIRITAKQFSFAPNEIRLKLNEKVRFRITSEDIMHGFTVPDLGINETVQPGKETIINLQASKRGTFTTSCSVVCGTGHSDMRGTIIVE